MMHIEMDDGDKVAFIFKKRSRRMKAVIITNNDGKADVVYP